jgi:hypothetical protein
MFEILKKCYTKIKELRKWNFLMSNIIDLNNARIKRIYKLTPEYLLEKYLKKIDFQINVIDLALNIKEFKFEFIEFDTSIDKEFNNFFATISNIDNEYILHYKKGMTIESLRLCISYSLSYITSGFLDNEKSKCVHIDEKSIRGECVREHEKKAEEFTKRLLMPKEVIFNTINRLREMKVECNIGNIARMLEVSNIGIVTNRLIELKYINN